MAASAAKINVSASDGGLKEIYKEMCVHAEIINFFNQQGVNTLSEFVNCFTVAGYENEAVAFRDKVEETKDKMVEGARLRGAVLLGREVKALQQKQGGDQQQQQQQAAAQRPQQEPDTEAPLTKEDNRLMAEAWTKRYGVVLDMYVDPTDTLVNRLFREFRGNVPTLSLAEKIKSVYFGTTPPKEKSVELANKAKVVFDADDGVMVKGVYEYYFALRILANASAKAGNYLVDSFVSQAGDKVVYAPLDVNMTYADRCLQLTLDRQLRPWEAVEWLREKDLHTRAIMVSKMRQGYPQGEALTTAMSETKVDWTTGRRLQRHRSRSPRRRSRSRPGKGGSGGGNGSGGKGGGSKGGKHGGRDDDHRGGRHDKGSDTKRHAQFLSGHRKICIEYNRGRCSRDEANCPKKEWHRCSLIKPDGSTCGDKHPASNHNHKQH